MQRHISIVAVMLLIALVITATAGASAQSGSPNPTGANSPAPTVTPTPEPTNTLTSIMDSCENGIVVPDPDVNTELVSDCEALLISRDKLSGALT